MSIVTKYLSFDFKASLEKVANLLTLNTDPTRVAVNVISSICELGVWSFIVGAYNDDPTTSAMVKQFKTNLHDSCIKYKESPVIGIYNFAAPFTQVTLARYLTFLACNCIKLISYVQIVGSPSCTNPDTLLILNTNDICKAYKLFKSTDLSTDAALCNYDPVANPNTNATISKATAAKPSVVEVVGQTFATFLNGLSSFINKDQVNNDVAVSVPAPITLPVAVANAQIKTPFSVSKVQESVKTKNKK
jgi:hypothetical protein